VSSLFNMLSLSMTPLSLSPPIVTRAGAPQMMAKGADAQAFLADLADGQNIPGLPAGSIWDPLGLAKQDFWEQGNEATIGWLRHAEIKHGRVAMAAFVGYIVGANKIAFPWALTGGPLAGTGPFEGVPGETIMFSDIAAAGCPMDQWDALPSAAKCQILGTIFILEWIGEGGKLAGLQQHYMRGGKPGAYPSLIKASEAGIIPHPVPFDLFNPLGLLPFDSMSEEAKARGRNAEINNGRAAMIGIFGFISASKGLIVPGLDSIEGIGRYNGVYMGAFSDGDTGLPFVSSMLESVPGLAFVLAANAGA